MGYAIRFPRVLHFDKSVCGMCTQRKLVFDDEYFNDKDIGLGGVPIIVRRKILIRPNSPEEVFEVVMKTTKAALVSTGVLAAIL